MATLAALHAGLALIIMIECVVAGRVIPAFTMSASPGLKLAVRPASERTTLSITAWRWRSGSSHPRQRTGNGSAARPWRWPLRCTWPGRGNNNTLAMMEGAQKNTAAANLVHMPGFLLLGGGVSVKPGNEVIEAVGVGGAPGGHLDEQCAVAAIEKAKDQLK